MPDPIDGAKIRRRLKEATSGLPWDRGTLIDLAVNALPQLLDQADAMRARADKAERDAKEADECEAASYQGNVDVAKALGLEVWGTDELGPAVESLKTHIARLAGLLREAGECIWNHGGGPALVARIDAALKESPHA